MTSDEHVSLFHSSLVTCHSPLLLSSGGWNRTNGLLVQSQASLPAATAPESPLLSDSAPHRKVRGEGVEPSSPGSRPGSLPLADPREGGRRGSRTLKAHRSAVFGTAAIACWLALPVRAAAAGIEPAIVSLTGSRLTIRPHRSRPDWPHRSRPDTPVGQSGRWDSNPRFPVPETGGAFLRPDSEHPAGIEPARPAWQAGRLPLHHGCTKWDPRDLNPHRPG